MTTLTTSEFANSSIISNEEFQKLCLASDESDLERHIYSRGIAFHYNKDFNVSRFPNVFEPACRAYLQLSDGSYLLSLAYTDFHLINAIADSLELLPDDLKLIKITETTDYESSYIKTEYFFRSLGFKSRRLDYRSYDEPGEDESLRDRLQINHICNYAVHEKTKLSFPIDDKTYLSQFTDACTLMLILVENGFSFSIRKDEDCFLAEVESPDRRFTVSKEGKTIDDAARKAVHRLIEIFWP